ncbi:hypothetical protein BABINDRAFT_176847 [Babjeviella inositovora NRRL Y-12698]|uniref:Condensin complex subunit 2 n=1 Tax=Babjeviella inositovora NRRL Y-12698 TaxID=984486 RepID=A0A1E3QNL3_9ASCO|nr:uncharacterized protein BABINDRAFT_176847 [Babjeviella inositovora NRRL Y-12698]ODQ79299.1 hypothetical protein BABINDRAFT_176847 [Babjeviella inositovora NRRL Y-12698]
MAANPRQTIISRVDNFDHWIRLATDNKINSSNSWKVALIDYFHDLSCLRDGDGINFQKASATLDGCVKIYSSRVDSAATETGKLLSGLASRSPIVEESNNKEPQEVLRVSRPKKHSETTLAKSFDAIKAKSVESELAVDPLFKKVLADFDEGGAKALLLNMLKGHKSGRVMFAEETEESVSELEARIGYGKPSHTSDRSPDLPNAQSTEAELVTCLGQRFFPDLSLLASFKICPSMDGIEKVLHDDDLTSLLEEVNVYENNQIDDFDMGNPHSIFYDEEAEPGDSTGPNNTMQRLFDESFQRELSPVHETVSELPDMDILAYFDYTLRKNWAGAEHWKIQSVKKPQQAKPVVIPSSKEKFVIDFSQNSPETFEEELFIPGANLLLPKTHWVSHSKNILPHDIQFSTKRLVRLFHKESMILTVFNKRGVAADIPADENFWAANYEQEETILVGKSQLDVLRDDMNEIHQSFDHTYLSNNPNTSYLLNLEGEDAFDGADWDLGGYWDDGQGYGSQLVQGISQQAKTPMLSFARVVKRVDVKLLKRNLWECFEKTSHKRSGGTEESIEAGIDRSNSDLSRKEEETYRFTELAREVNAKYAPEMRKDISTSFLFICLLHLANENGLEIANDGNRELLVRK